MIRLLHHGPQTGVRNMAVDEALLESAKEGGVTLRFYEWETATLSFGRNQTAAGQYDAESAAARGIDIVRRPTGGRAVFHHRELTYSVTAPADMWGPLRDAYCRINQALALGLQALGAPVVCAGERVTASVSGADNPPIPGPTARACFRDPLPGEVTAEGRKLIGSAQWRNGGALLQHGSILLVNEQQVTEELRIGEDTREAAAKSDAQTGAIGLTDILADVPPIDILVAALTSGFESEFDYELDRGSLSAAEIQAADRLATRYTNPDWTWRR